MVSDEKKWGVHIKSNNPPLTNSLFTISIVRPPTVRGATYRECLVYFLEQERHAI